MTASADVPWMRVFVFTLRLPDGRFTVVREAARPWEWSVAFGRACASAELRYGFESLCGITCVDFDSGWDLVVSEEMVRAA